MSDDPWLTEKEAAKELRVSPGTVRRERLDGKLGYSTIRGRIFYPLSQVTAYKLGQTKPCQSKTGQTTASSNDLTLIIGTLDGPKDAVASAVQQAQKMRAKLSSSSRRSA